MKHTHTRDQTIGAACALCAFLIWGLSPIYWKALGSIPPPQITAHRIVWSALLLLLLVSIRGQWNTLRNTIQTRKHITTLVATALLLSVNWMTYIWAVDSGLVRQASLGYYITPLVNVLLGMVFLKERLSPYQAVAVLIAATAVTGLAIVGGVFPWASLLLAASFGSYGLLRKKAPIDPLVGLTIETVILSIPAATYLLLCTRQGTAHLADVDGLLLASSIVTATPLLLFNTGAKRLRLATIGLMQYLAPTCMFLLAAFLFREPFAKADTLAFLLIWSALAIYTTDALRNRNYRPSRPSHISR